MHDPAEYPDPECFEPERYLSGNGSLNPDIRDPNTIAFGFGRRYVVDWSSAVAGLDLLIPPCARICPGRDISDATLFICIASILHVYDISPEIDPSGRPLWPKVDVTSSLVRYALEALRTCFGRF